MKNFIKRIFCPHLNWTDIFLDETKLYMFIPRWQKVWKCTKCGEEKAFDIFSPPIQYQ